MKEYYMEKEISEQPLTLSNSLNRLSQFDEVIKEILDYNVKFVVIAARGSSRHAAMYAKYLIEYKLGVPVSLSAPSIHTMYNKEINYSDTLVIGISQSGMAMDVFEVIEEAKKYNGLTLSLTNDEDSLLAITSKHHLDLDVGKETSVAATKSFSSQIMNIAILVSLWSDEEVMYEELLSVPKNIENMLESINQYEENIVDITNIGNIFVLGRGFSYPIALETALKIQETTYLNAIGFSISEFHHGPFAMIDSRSLVIIFSSYGETFNNTFEMIKKLHRVGAKLVIVGSGKGLSSYGSVFNIPPCKNDYESAFYYTIWAQNFALKLSAFMGLNPDNPRGLNKITITK